MVKMCRLSITTPVPNRSVPSDLAVLAFSGM